MSRSGEVRRQYGMNEIVITEVGVCGGRATARPGGQGGGLRRGQVAGQERITARGPAVAFEESRGV
jgi:hypothetical protein